MAATNQNIKDFFALSGNNPAVTNPKLVRLQTLIDRELGLPAGTNSTPDQFVDWLYEHLVDMVLDWEEGRAQDLVARPTF